MLNSTFGLSTIGKLGPAEKLARDLPDPVTDGTLLRLLLMQEYDTHYGIFNHDDPHLEKTRPLAAVAMHEREKVGPHSSILRAQIKYVRYNIRELTGMSFDQFHAQPRDVVTDWYLIAIDEKLKGSPSNNAAEKAVKEMERNLGGKV